MQLIPSLPPTLATSLTPKWTRVKYVPHWRNNDPHPCSHQIYANGKNLGEFCGKQRPPDLDTSSNAVDLLFFTDESGDSRGWKLHYTTESKRFTVECSLHALDPGFNL